MAIIENFTELKCPLPRHTRSYLACNIQKSRKLQQATLILIKLSEKLQRATLILIKLSEKLQQATLIRDWNSLGTHVRPAQGSGSNSRTAVAF